MSLFTELERRNVFRVGAAYAAISWLVIQIAETTFPAFGLGEAAIRFVIILAAVGFIPSLIFAWAFELTPEGFKRDSEVDRASPVTRRMTQRLDRLVMVTLALALGYFAIDKFVLSPERQAQELATATEEARQEGRTEAIIESYGDKSIAVLPFADLSLEGDQQYLSDGISEELLNLLAKYDGLRVISRSSSFSLRDSGLSVPELGRQLDVGYVLEGSVRKQGKTVRITAQLIEARSDTHLWSETYDRELDDVFAIQDQISARVVQELKVRLLTAAVSTPTDTDAYELYLQGLLRLARRGPGDPSHAVELFERAIDLDPDYAPAHASLALAQIWDWEGNYGERIEAEANRALELDPGNSDALSALGLLWTNLGRTEEARQALEEAIASNPNNATAYRWLGRSYSNVDPARYLALVERAYHLDPLDPSIHYHLAIANLKFGRIKSALSAARQRLKIDPTDGMSFMLAGMIHRQTGHLDLALQSFYQGYLADPTQWNFGAIFWTLADLGELELAETWQEELKRQAHWTYVEPDEAILTFLTGRPDEALQLQSAAFQRGEISAQDLAFWVMRFSNDFDRALTLYQQGFSELGLDPDQFDADLPWRWYTDYALLMRRSGNDARAEGLIRDIRTMTDAQLAAGVIIGSVVHLKVVQAMTYALSGDSERAVEALHGAMQDGQTCVWCLEYFPNFDSLRDEPQFNELIAEMEARNAAQHRDLANRGLLLTPQELLQLKDYSFDPFSN